MGGSASSSPAVQKSLANFMDAMSGGLNSQPALDQYSKQFRNMPDAAIRGVGDAVASIPDMAIAAGKLAMEGGFNPRMGQSERVKRFADTTYMPINPMMQDALTRAGVAETEGGNNLTRFVSGAMAPYAMGKYAGAVGDAIGAAERGALSNAERGMFAGVGAKTADLKALKVAEKLEADGVDKDVIWGQTGWGRGADNKWRFEIDDSGARLMRGVKTKIKNNGIATGSAKEILDHPELYAAEPKNRGLYHRATTMFGNEGSWDAGKKSILASGKTNDEILSTSLHEHQHAIQDRAGFAQGSSPDNFDYGPMFDKRARDLIGDLSKSLTGDYSHNYYSTLSKDLHLGDKSELNRIVKKYGFDNIEDGMKFLKIEDAKRSPYEQYRRVAGEVEARNVQTRMNMTPAERLLTPPWKTEDVARDKQIVRLGGGKSMSLPTDNLPMDEASRNLVRLPNEIDAKKLNEVMEEMKVLGRPRIDVVDTGEEYLALEGSHRLTAAHKLGIKPIYNIVDQNAIINPNKYDVDTYNFKWDEDSPHSAGEMAFEMYGDGKNGRLDFGKLPNDLPMDEASRIVTYRGSDLHPDILNAIKPIVGQKQRSQELSNIKKMQIPIEEMEAKRRLLPKRDLPVFDVNNIPTGSWLLGSPADAMKGAAELTEINGLKLKAPVRLDGGIDYAQMHKSPGWSSEKSAGTVWMNNVNKQLADGKDIWPSIVAMSARGTTSTKAMANLQTQRLANIEIPRRSADAMTKMLRGHKVSVKTDNGYRVTFPFKDAPSFRNQNEMAEYIDSLELTQRGRFFEALDKAKTPTEGVPNLMPDLASARFALADENQLGIPAGSSGMLITRMNRPMTMEEVLKGQEGYHPGYRYRQSGFDVAGKTEVSIPPQVWWKDPFQKIIDRGRSPEEAAVVLPRPMGGGPLLQEVTNEWKDLVSKVIEDHKKSGSGRNALLPLGAGGAGAISVDYDEEERKLKRDRKRKKANLNP